MSGTRLRRPDRGSASVEVVILAPVFILLVALAVVVGRTAVARNAVDLAAHAAARAASIARDAETARADGEVAVEDVLAEQRLNCDPAAAVELAAERGDGTALDLDEVFDPAVAPVGTVVFIVATVTCEVSFGDLAVPGMPGSVMIERTFVSPLDRFRSRG